MPRTVLQLSLTLDDVPAHVVACAAELQTRLAPDHWALLAQLAAEIVARWETTAAQRRVLVVQAADLPEELARGLQAAGLPAA